MANFYTPDTAVYLCNVPINSNQKNQFVPYTSVQNGTVWVKDQYQDQQRQWFSDHTTHSFTDFTYQRKDNIIRVPVNAETLFADGTNYCYYQNTHYNGKWFYCFIERIEFINENMTALHIKTDVFQTWFFEFYKSNHMDVNFIARETVIKDEIFKHTLAEPVPKCEHICKEVITIVDDLNSRTLNEFDDNYYCAIFCSELVKFISATIPRIDSFVGGIPCPCYIYATSISDFYNFMDKINENGQASAVVACVAVPKSIAVFHDLGSPTPPEPPITNTYLGSPYANNFTINQIYAPYNNHYGIDMSGFQDKTLYATTNGEVVYAGWNTGGYGNLVVIHSSDNNLYYIYGHMANNSIVVNVGDVIVSGTKIGKEGSTGESTGSHVHYEITSSYNTSDWNSGSVNPAQAIYGAQYPNEEGFY